MFKFDAISQYCNNFEDCIGFFPSILCNFWRFLGILGSWGLVRFWDFSKDFFLIFDEVYEDFQSNLPLGIVKRLFFLFFSFNLIIILTCLLSRARAFDKDP
jgi:hypothetical protein